MEWEGATERGWEAGQFPVVALITTWEDCPII